MVFVVGTINVNGSAVGFRLFNLDKQETEDISKMELYRAVASGKRKIENVVVDKKIKNFRIINSMPLGVIDKPALHSSAETLTTDVCVVLASVVEDGTDSVMGYLVSTNEPAFAVYRTEDLIAVFDDLNICHKGISVVNGELQVNTETALPVLQYSDVSAFMEDFEDAVSTDDVTADSGIENVEDYVDMDVIEDSDTFEELLSEADISEQDAEYADVVAETDAIEDMDAIDVIDGEDAGVLPDDEQDAKNGYEDELVSEFETVTDSLSMEVDTPLNMQVDSVTSDEIISDDADSSFEAMLSEMEETPEMTEQAELDEETIMADNQSNMIETVTATVTEQFPVNTTVSDTKAAAINKQSEILTLQADEPSDNVTVTQEAEKLSLSISNEFDNADDMWKITVVVNGERTTVVLPANDVSVSDWLKVPGLSLEDNCVRRATTSNTLVDSANLVAVVVPKSVKRLCAFAFAYCTALESITFMASDDLVVPMGCFAGCTVLQRIETKGKIVAVEDYAFADCTAFDGADIIKTNAIVRIGAYAFTNTGTTAVEFNDKIETVGMAAFAMCSKLVKAILTYAIVRQWATAEKNVAADMLSDKDIRRKYALDVFASCTQLNELNLRDEDIVRMVPYYLQGTALAMAV